jgi:hypothetical protein
MRRVSPNQSKRRIRSGALDPYATPVIAKFGMSTMTRQQAVQKVRTLLNRSPRHPLACQLVDLFQISAEELTESGVPYEVVRAVSRFCTI